jgi:hypothetical protein
MTQGARLGRWRDLSDRLDALASPVRLQLRDQLDVPKRSSEVSTRAADEYGDLPPDRSLSRSTLQTHLEKLDPRASCAGWRMGGTSPTGSGWRAWSDGWESWLNSSRWSSPTWTKRCRSSPRTLR